MSGISAGQRLGAYTVLKPVGAGAFGDVFLVSDSKNEQKIAKHIKLEKLRPQQREAVMQEIKLLADFSDHPYIVRYHEAFLLEKAIVVIMDYCSSILPLGIYIVAIHRKNREYMKEEHIVSFLVQIVAALHYMHSKKVLHRDLKPGNVLLTRENRIKLADFGISKPLENNLELAKTQVGTPNCMSPELIEKKGYGYPSDIWALGCILYEMIALKEPFHGESLMPLLKSIVHDKVPPLPKIVSSELSNICYSMLDKDPSKRPTTVELIGNPIIHKMSKAFAYLSLFVVSMYLVAFCVVSEPPAEGSKRLDSVTDFANAADTIKLDSNELLYGLSQTYVPRYRGCPNEEDFVCGSDGRTYTNMCTLLMAKKLNRRLFYVYNGKCKNDGTCHRECPLLLVAEFKCGTDSVSYPSLCDLQEAGCKQKKEIIKKHDGECNKCADACIEIYNPVCGSDGITYDNDCFLEKASCESYHGIYPLHRGKCAGSDICSRTYCPNVSDPVCGNDGKTYLNQCVLDIFSCRYPKLFSVYEGRCRGRGCSRSCPRIPGPQFVCGSDGYSYNDLCELQNSSCKSPTKIEQLHDGKCKECNQRCPEIYAPVCGSDGVTYENVCSLNAAACNAQKQITVVKKGKCNEECNPICTGEYKPVCGSDGNTYGNKCSLNYTACTSGKDINIVHIGECKPCDKPCTKEYKPVCGFDGVTYGNRCIFEIAQCRNPKLQLSHIGKCDCEVEHCTREYNPMCGTDRVTYGNPCDLKNATCKNHGKVTLLHLGPCKRECDMKCVEGTPPVCGTDGMSYKDACTLKIKACELQEPIDVLREGKCKPECENSCEDIDDWVCGEDGHSYKSKCVMDVAGCNTGTTMVYQYVGKCKVEGCPEVCPLHYTRVCASNGETYSNMCFLMMAQCNISRSITYVHDGPCAE